jgi:Transaldolase/Fructose-6-phosphate aldolase
MKVPATYEGLKACRQLKADGIKTLATTVFTMEQVILAGEAGCVSISPFVHELKMGFDSTYVPHFPPILCYPVRGGLLITSKDIRITIPYWTSASKHSNTTSKTPSQLESRPVAASPLMRFCNSRAWQHTPSSQGISKFWPRCKRARNS